MSIKTFITIPFKTNADGIVVDTEHILLIGMFLGDDDKVFFAQ